MITAARKTQMETQRSNSTDKFTAKLSGITFFRNNLGGHRARYSRKKIPESFGVVNLYGLESCFLKDLNTDGSSKGLREKIHLMVFNLLEATLVFIGLATLD